MYTLLTITAALLLAPAPAVEGLIKCYCNSPDCAVGGRYACMSESSRCFSKLYSAYQASSSSATAQHQPTRRPPDEHGCVDHLPARQRGVCDGMGDLVKQNERGDAIIVCCSDNLCNYIENQDNPVDSGSSDSGKAGSTGTPREKHQNPKAAEYSRPAHDAWFTAAIVCVPIIGGLILVALVLIAVRMLRSDQRRPSQKRHGGIDGSGLGRRKSPLADHLPWRQGKRGATLAAVHNYGRSDVYKDVSVQVGHWLNGVSICSLRADSVDYEEVSSSVLVWHDQSAASATVSVERTSGERSTATASPAAAIV